MILKYDYQERIISFELQIYRIIQEFLSNVIKHAKASIMTIYIRGTKDSLALILSDNGIGFDIDELQKGMGLQNIDSRIKSINGSAKWKSEKSYGTRLIMKI